MSSASQLPGGTQFSAPVVVPVSPVPPQAEPVVKPLEQIGPRPLPPLNRCSIWNVPFDQVDLSEAVDRIARLIQRRQPSYVITANLNYVMLHNQSARSRRSPGMPT